MGASARNFGLLMPGSIAAVEPWPGFAAASLAWYRRLQSETELGLRHGGSLYTAFTPAEVAVLREYAAIAPDSCHLYTGTALAKFPWLGAGIVAALHFPYDAWLSPTFLLARLVPYLSERPRVNYRPNCPVVGLEPKADAWAVALTEETLLADFVFLCTGHEVHTLAPEALTTLPGQPEWQIVRLQMQATAPVHEPVGLPTLSGLSIRRYPVFRSCPSFAALEKEAVEPYWTDNGVHVIVSPHQGGGLVLGDSHHYFPALQNPAPFQTDAELNRRIRAYAQTLVHFPLPKTTRTWTGTYLQHPELPALTTELSPGLLVLTGLGGKGMSTAPGWVAAELRSRSLV